MNKNRTKIERNRSRTKTERNEIRTRTEINTNRRKTQIPNTKEFIPSTQTCWKHHNLLLQSFEEME
jgi:hypothetical protein